MRPACLMVAVAILASGCPRPPNQNNNNEASTSSSSSSTGGGTSSGGAGSSSSSTGGTGSSSSAAASSSSGGGTGSSSSSTGGPQVDPLCARLASGYARVFTATLAPLNLNNGTQDCAPEFANDDQAVAYLMGSMDHVIAQMCGADGGTMALTVAQIMASQQAGRAIYSESLADQCNATGRALLADGGLFGTGGLEGLDAGTWLFDSCLDAVMGLQGDGEPCGNSLECARGDAGAQCVNRTGMACEGVCAPLRRAGEPCGEGSPDCREGLDCVNGTCEQPRGPDQPCAVDGGSLPCQDGLRCLAGTCQPRADVNDTCDNDSDCAEGLRCNVQDVCEPLGGVGANCSGSSFFAPRCQKCLGCFEPPPGVDGGPPTCQPFASLGESCANAPCHVGLACSQGQCVALAGSGEPCVRIDAPDETRRGNCASALEACVGTPLTCQRRADVGQQCFSLAGDEVSVGSCRVPIFSEPDQWCVRTRSTDTTGICVPEAAPGEPCGYAFNVPLECLAPEGASARCSASRAGEVGTCVYSSNGPEGAPCESDFGCASGHYCQLPTNDAGPNPVGECARGGVLNARCGVGEPWGAVCLEGTCRQVPDGGSVLRCQPYKAVGEACARFSDECGPDARCDVPITGGATRCIALGSEGATCDRDSVCASGLVCRSGECIAPVCEDTSSEGCSEGGTIPMLLFFGACVWTGWRRKRHP